MLSIELNRRKATSSRWITEEKLSTSCSQQHIVALDWWHLNRRDSQLALPTTQTQIQGPVPSLHLLVTFFLRDRRGGVTLLGHAPLNEARFVAHELKQTQAEGEVDQTAILWRTTSVIMLSIRHLATAERHTQKFKAQAKIRNETRPRLPSCHLTCKHFASSEPRKRNTEVTYSRFEFGGSGAGNRPHDLCT